MSDTDKIKDWLKSGNKFTKIEPGDKLECIFRGMTFDATGGYQGKSTIKYSLEDIKDKIVRELSSTAKSFAQQMMKIKEGDTIVIHCSENERRNKVYRVEVLRGAKQTEALAAESNDVTEVTDDLFADDGEDIEM